MKSQSLSDALAKAASRRSSSPQNAEPGCAAANEVQQRAQAPTPSRQGKKVIAGFFDPAVSRQLKQIGIDHDSSVQELLREALNDIFTKYGEAPLA